MSSFTMNFRAKNNGQLVHIAYFSINLFLAEKIQVSFLSSLKLNEARFARNVVKNETFG